eukprot:scaffold1747_cov392-Prasinococcus_capsulatus_cf.AAC.7
MGIKYGYQCQRPRGTNFPTPLEGPGCLTGGGEGCPTEAGGAFASESHARRLVVPAHACEPHTVRMSVGAGPSGRKGWPARVPTTAARGRRQAMTAEKGAADCLF